MCSRARSHPAYRRPSQTTKHSCLGAGRGLLPVMERRIGCNSAPPPGNGFLRDAG